MHISEALNRDKVLVLDGALATELERHGADLDHALWSARMLLESPDLIEHVHLDYLQSGADIITTASYQASHEGMNRCGLSDADADNAIRCSVSLAESARQRYRNSDQRPVFIAGSVGPYGAMLHDGSEYRGDYRISDSVLDRFHGPRLRLLNTSAVDVIAIETIPDFQELKVLLQMLDRETGPPAWIAMSCVDDALVCDGTAIEECASAADRCDRVIAFGVNCTAPQFVDGLLERISDTTRKPMVVYPNSGEHYDASSGSWVADEADPLPGMESIASWAKAGARIIGGCCRTTPMWISRVAATLKTARL